MMTLVFTTSPGLVSWLVRAFTRASCSHVGIGFSLYGVPVVLHAYGRGGVKIETRASFLRDRRIVREFYVQNEALVRTALPQVLKEIGDRYDYVSLAFFALRRFGLLRRKPWVSPDAIVCSELVARLPLPAFEGLDPELVSPEELLQVCYGDDAFTQARG